MKTQANFLNKQFARVGKIFPSPSDKQTIGSSLKFSTNQISHISKL